jgi:hypothetical protein
MLAVESMVAQHALDLPLRPVAKKNINEQTRHKSPHLDQSCPSGQPLGKQNLGSVSQDASHPTSQTHRRCKQIGTDWVCNVLAQIDHTLSATCILQFKYKCVHLPAKLQPTKQQIINHAHVHARQWCYQTLVLQRLPAQQ